MKTYKITVNGKVFEVDVEEVGGTVQRPALSPSTPAAAPAAPKAAPAPAAASAAPLAGEGRIDAPMPGTVLDVLVSPGEQVEAGQVLVILEAMKMENEIMAPMAGKVIQVNTTKGAAVNSGDPLLVIG
ncbi:MAG: biotin/lipoyl-binding protein [Tissierellia bacterium]|nr:biotin/lipoyl-binding protein [Tissierellia bacterium]